MSHFSVTTTTTTTTRKAVVSTPAIYLSLSPLFCVVCLSGCVYVWSFFGLAPTISDKTEDNNIIFLTRTECVQKRSRKLRRKPYPSYLVHHLEDEKMQTKKGKKKNDENKGSKMKLKATRIIVILNIYGWSFEPISCARSTTQASAIFTVFITTYSAVQTISPICSPNKKLSETS